MISQVIDANHYGVFVGGMVIEMTCYRTDITLGVGDPVFIERVDGSQLWQISDLALGSPSGPSSGGWFTVDHDLYGVVDGPGRIRV